MNTTNLVNTMTTKKKINVVDCTLREGMQTPGIDLTQQEMLDIVLKLDKAGVTLIDAGMPAAGKEIQDFLKAAIKLNTKLKIGGSVRCNLNEVKAAIDCGLQSVFLICPISDIHLNSRLNMTLEFLCEELECCMALLNQHGIDIEIAAEDASRASLGNLTTLFETAIKGGAQRIYLADTVGYAKPSEYRALIRNSLRMAAGRIEVGVHCHNDLGMATANTVMAIEEGVTWPTVTVNGIGERAGNASFIEVVTATAGPLNCNTDIQFKYLPELSSAVEKATGFIVPPNYPIVGQNAFRHESGIHVDGLLKSPQNYEAVDPAMFGLARNLVLGKQSGRAHIRAILDRKKLRYVESDIDLILGRIKEQCQKMDMGTIHNIHLLLKDLIRRNNIITEDQLDAMVGEVLMQRIAA